MKREYVLVLLVLIFLVFFPLFFVNHHFDVNMKWLSLKWLREESSLSFWLAISRVDDECVHMCVYEIDYELFWHHAFFLQSQSYLFFWFNFFFLLMFCIFQNLSNFHALISTFYLMDQSNHLFFLFIVFFGEGGGNTDMHSCIKMAQVKFCR